jgi:UDP-glucose 4-epimerase
MEPRRVLVTGGAGFIGSEIVRQLTENFRELEIVVVDNLTNGSPENLQGLLTEGVRLVVVDIRDEVRMTAVLRGIDWVFHLACLGVRHSIHSPVENHDVNATATLRLLSWAKEAGVRRFVHVSSSEVYGTARWAPMSEDHPTLPTTIYGASKLAGECYARAFYRTYGYPTVVVRPFNTYGPRCHHEGDSGEVIPKFLLRSMADYSLTAFGDGKQTRDFSYVSDTARGIILAGWTDSAIGETINLGTGSETSINELASEIAAVVGRPTAALIHDEPRPGDVMRLCADISKARELLRFEPQIALREGLTNLRDWYLARGKSPAVLLDQEIIRNWEPTASRSEK